MISLLEEIGFTELSAAHRGESGVIVLKAPTLLNKTQRNLSPCINLEITTLFPSVERLKLSFSPVKQLQLEVLFTPHFKKINSIIVLFNLRETVHQPKQGNVHWPQIQL